MNRMASYCFVCTPTTVVQLMLTAFLCAKSAAAETPFVSSLSHYCPNMAHSPSSPHEMNHSSPNQKCYCDSISEDYSIPLPSSAITLSCVFGSTLADIQAALQLIRSTQNSKAVLLQSIFADAPKLSSAIPNGFFGGFNDSLRRLNIRNCESNNVSFAKEAFAGVEGSLWQVSIFACPLDSFPAAINSVKSLKTLELTHCGIEELPNNAFSNLQNLTTLDLSTNYMTHISSSAFDGLSNLEDLRLGEKNHLNEKHLATIARALPSLRNLSLSHNDIMRIPENIFRFQKQLRSLDLSFNYIENITDFVFKGLQQLTRLNLRVNTIRSLSLNAFAGLRRLQQLTLAGNYLDNLTAAHFHQKMASLIVLDLSSNELTHLASRSFDSLKQLEWLDLSDNQQLAAIDKAAFVGLSKLRRLSLARTNITEIGNELFQPLSTLSELNLSKTPLRSLGIHALQSLKSLKMLNLAETNLTGLSSEAWLPNDAQIMKIDLSDNNWNCTSHLLWLSDWLRERLNKGLVEFQLLNSERTTCGYPKELQKRQTKLIDFNVKLLTEVTADLNNSRSNNSQPWHIAAQSADAATQDWVHGFETAAKIPPQSSHKNTSSRDSNSTTATSALAGQDVTKVTMVFPTRTDLATIKTQSRMQSTKAGIVIGVSVAVLVCLATLAIILIVCFRRTHCSNIMMPEQKQQSAGITTTESKVIQNDSVKELSSKPHKVNKIDRQHIASIGRTAQEHTKL